MNPQARTGLTVGLPFLFVPINTVAHADVPPEKAPDAVLGVLAKASWIREDCRGRVVPKIRRMLPSR